MKKYIHLFVFALFLSAPLQSAQAAKVIDWLFTPKVPDFSLPYLENGKMSHLALYSQEPELMEQWAAQRGGKNALIKDFYQDGVLRDQDLDDKVPNFKVGTNFMRLSGADKRRVAQFLDYAYNITGREGGSGTFVLNHWRTCDPIGIYTKDGLQLQ